MTKKSVCGGDRSKRLLQRKTYWIWSFKAMEYPGLNEETDYTFSVKVYI